MSRLGSIVLAVAVGVAVAFLLLPLLALFLRVPPGTLVALGPLTSPPALLIARLIRDPRPSERDPIPGRVSGQRCRLPDDRDALSR